MKKVLIVEDDKDFLWILRQNFDNQDFEVVYAENGEDGLALAEKEKPDLIIVDILMPKMDGIEMAKKLKEKRIIPQMIFLTNLKDENHISQVMEITGGADYIVKADVSVLSIVERLKNKLGI